MTPVQPERKLSGSAVAKDGTEKENHMTNEIHGIRLMDATIEQIQAYAAWLGYDFTAEDCEEVKQTRAPWNDQETVGEAVDDFLRAFEA